MATILIVDDNPHHMEIASMLLENHTVLKAGSAEEGLTSALRELRADPATQAIKTYSSIVAPTQHHKINVGRVSAA